MNHRLNIAGLLIAMMFFFAACGGSQPAARSPANEEPAKAEAPAEKPEEKEEAAAEEEAMVEPVTITFWDNQQTESGLSEFQQIAVDEFMAANPEHQRLMS